MYWGKLAYKGLLEYLLCCKSLPQDLHSLQRSFIIDLIRKAMLMLVLLWLRLFATLLCLSQLFEFPDNIRHLCTTMPWTIRPSLVVLWGVCWMFFAHRVELEEDRDQENGK